jgi:hypothetical protein
MIPLRPATSDDVEAIAAVWHPGWHDGRAFDYAAGITGGTLLVPCRRYEKCLTGDPER